MRILARAILLALIVTSKVAAQGTRFSFELAGGPATTSSIIDHELVSSGLTILPGTMVTHLTIADGSVLSARMAYRVTGQWTLVGELGQGTTEYQFYQSFAGSTTNSYMHDQRGAARRTAFGLGVTRRATLFILPLSIEPELDISMQQIRVGDATVACALLSPGLGGFYSCPVYPPWQRTYSVPSVGGGVALGYAIAPWIAAQLRGRYAVGRTSTEVGLFEGILPQFNWSDAPTSRSIRSTVLSVGLRIQP